MGNNMVAELSPERPTRPSTGKKIGSLVNMQKQDPSVADVKYGQMWIPDGVRLGKAPDDLVAFGHVDSSHVVLETDDVIAANFGPLPPGDDSGNYLYDIDTTFGIGGSCLATVQSVLTMYRRALKRMGVAKPLNWHSGKQLLVLPCDTAANKGLALYAAQAYSPGQTLQRDMIAAGVIILKEDLSDILSPGSSYDTIAHETGHAILDALRPEWNPNWRAAKEPTAFSEAFGDMTALLGLTDQLDTCEKAIVAAKGDLHAKTFFVKVGEQIAEKLMESDCIRNADNDLRIDEVTNETHDLSQVFVGAFYDTLVDIYDLNTDLSRYNPAIVLHQTGQHLMEVLLAAVINQKSEKPTIIDMAAQLMQEEKKPEYRAIMKKHFDLRRMFDPTAKPKPVPVTESGDVSTMTKRMVSCGNDLPVVSITSPYGKKK